VGKWGQTERERERGDNNRKNFAGGANKEQEIEIIKVWKNYTNNNYTQTNIIITRTG